MIVIRSLNPSKGLLDLAKDKLNNLQAAVTIGGFDGLHQGHRHIFDKLFKVANAQNLCKVLITFEPRPVDYFCKKNNVTQGNNLKRLSLLSDKLFFLKNIGFDLVWVINFNYMVANMTAQQFLSKIYSVLDIKYLFVGQDFRFGKGRQGDLELLKQYAFDNKFIFETVKDYMINGQRVSSSGIRALLSHSNKKTDFLELANNYLARYYGFFGKVVSGQQQGRKLGYPTANIHVKPGQLLLSQGVYAVNIVVNNKRYHAMANWGIRPTISNSKALNLVLEAHIFDFDADIYGKKVYIEFLAKIRSEQKFQSMDELRVQLSLDDEYVNKFFKKQV